MYFFNDRELALRFKNNLVSSQERLLYYIVPIMVYALGYVAVIGFIYAIISMLLMISPADIFQGDILKNTQEHLRNITEFYKLNANKTLSEVLPKEVFDSFVTSFDSFIHSKTPIKDMEYFTKNTKTNYFFPAMIVNLIAYYILPIIGIVVCYKTNKLGDDKEFLERFISLSFPVVIRAFVMMIPVYIVFSMIPETHIIQIINMPYLAFLAYFYWRLNTSIKIASS